MEIIGTVDSDTLIGGIGNDSIYGLEGDDRLEGNEGRDRLEGGDGYDTLLGGGGRDFLYGNEGDDVLNGGYGPDVMRGGAGYDTYIVDDVGDEVYEVNDWSWDSVYSSVSFTLSDYVEELHLEGSADLNGTANDQDCSLYGNAGTNVLIGGEGYDYLESGRGGNDTLVGGGGGDYIYVSGDAGTVVVSGDAGDDYIEMYGNDDGATMDGGDGDDTFYLDGSNDVVAVGGAGNDSFYLGSSQRVNIQGGDGNDHIGGYRIEGTYDGGAGDDYYVLDDSDVTIIEAADGGYDTVEVWSESYTADAGIESVYFYSVGTLTGNELDNVFQVEQVWWGSEEGEAASVYGADGNDHIKTYADAFVFGGAGNDTLVARGYDAEAELHGGGGNDVLDGSLGSAIMHGDSGNDVFVIGDGSYWDYAPATITDFNDWQDSIHLKDFNKLGPDGVLASRCFYAAEGPAAVAHDETDRLIFDTSSGALYYDADGTGVEAQVHIATITVTDGLLNHTDFTVT